MQQQPIFPCRLQQSIFGASELNFCVRNENRWDLTAIVTAMVYLGISSVNIFFLSLEDLQLHRNLKAFCKELLPFAFIITLLARLTLSYNH